MTIKETFKKYGIEFNNGRIYHKEFGWISLLLVDGNGKIGKGCYHFSTLPTNQMFDIVINGKSYTMKGTCVCNCKGCYACSGNFTRYPSVYRSLAIRTWLIRNDLEFVKRAILAQIEAYKIELCRIHASGDFDSDAYANMWREIVLECSSCAFWTYTKIAKYENLFNGISNANIVKSCINGYGFNFGHCDYILMVYRALKKLGKEVYICRCGIDKDQHCVNCKGCSKNEYVLFIEHSTEYKAEKDPCFPELKAIIESQAKQ